MVYDKENEESCGGCYVEAVRSKLHQRFEALHLFIKEKYDYYQSELHIPLYPRVLSCSDAGSAAGVWVMTSRFPLCLSVSVQLKRKCTKKTYNLCNGDVFFSWLKFNGVQEKSQ